MIQMSNTNTQVLAYNFKINLNDTSLLFNDIKMSNNDK